MSEERVAVNRDLLERALDGSDTAVRRLTLSDHPPISGLVCDTCGTTQCSEYSEGRQCPAPFCRGELTRVGTRADTTSGWCEDCGQPGRIHEQREEDDTCIKCDGTIVPFRSDSE